MDAQPKITETSKQVFIAYAQDAGNWNGMPLVGGNVGGTKEERGNLTQLKRAGLIETVEEKSDRTTWVCFTLKGVRYAKALGIDLDWLLQSEYFLAAQQKRAEEQK